MGEVFKPEDIRRREKEIPDLEPKPFSEPFTSTSIDDLMREVRELRAEVEKIKKTLRARGIPV